MPIKERIVDLAALASLISACGTGTDATSTTFDDGSTPPWDQTTGTDTSTGGRTSGAGDHGATRGGEGDDALDSTVGTTSDRPDDTTSATTGASSSGGETRGEPLTDGGDELPPIPDLGGGNDDDGDDDDGDDGDDDDDDAAATP